MLNVEVVMAKIEENPKTTRQIHRLMYKKIKTKRSAFDYAYKSEMELFMR